MVTLERKHNCPSLALPIKRMRYLWLWVEIFSSVPEMKTSLLSPYGLGLSITLSHRKSCSPEGLAKALGGLLLHEAMHCLSFPETPSSLNSCKSGRGLPVPGLESGRCWALGQLARQLQVPWETLSEQAKSDGGEHPSFSGGFHRRTCIHMHTYTSPPNTIVCFVFETGLSV